jgi:hypothetical protein
MFTANPAVRGGQASVACDNHVDGFLFGKIAHPPLRLSGMRARYGVGVAATYA